MKRRNFFISITLALLVIIVPAYGQELRNVDADPGGNPSTGVSHDPREILVIYDSTQADSIANTQPVLYGATPLNYMGYVPIYQSVQDPLPQGSLKGKYAGIIVWVNNDYAGIKQNLRTWLVRQKNNDIPIAFINFFGFPVGTRGLDPFDITTGTQVPSPKRINVTYSSDMMGYEMQPYPEANNYQPLKPSAASKVLLQISDEAGHKSDVAAITPWGGYVLYPFAITFINQDDARWVINPFAFFKQALRLKEKPVADTTTENGRRLMLVHVDGDAFISRTEWDPNMYAGEAMEKDIFEKYQIPTTVSVITGEIAKNGLYPEASEELMNIARSTYRLPWVEIASHSYSHPYLWQQIEKNPAQYSGDPLYNLPIPDYKFNLNDEITGTIDFINKYLAPPNKKTKMFLWTGDTDPSAAAVALTYKDKVGNMNGGDTIITDAHKTLTLVAPLGVPKGDYFQVYAPAQNENVYTNSWTGPFYGYKRAIQTFKLTDKPMRLKPIDIYYHYYSATKVASMKALKTVYDWALTQPTLNIFASEYFQKVLDFNKLTINKTDQGWLVKDNGNLRELRSPKSLGYPDLNKSKNIIGYHPHESNYYIHLGPAAESLLVYNSNKPKQPYLATANGFVDQFVRDGKTINMKLHGYLPLTFTLANMQGCKLVDGHNQELQAKHSSDGFNTYHLEGTSSGALLVQC
ncbi:MAG: hypothetical protein CMF50_09085 [Legionellales bacterium]|nr:hypothetical protein [Legionellales bacterium]|tara:strand:+ start:942 stop:3011 length:2070 start_codon:yes stop_codon:yes gene_type:complete